MPVILDGAQGAGAVPVDVKALGCVAYAAAGQKWLCGADGTGMLYLDPEFGERVRTIAPDLLLVRGRLARPGIDPARRRAPLRRRRCRARRVALSAARARGARGRGLRRDHRRAPPTSRDAFADRARRGRAHRRAARRAARSSSFEDPDPEADARAAARGAASPSATCPGTPYLRASVGAWNDESDLERLLAALL